jgi:hypothetical protein
MLQLLFSPLSDQLLQFQLLAELQASVLNLLWSLQMQLNQLSRLSTLTHQLPHSTGAQLQPSLLSPLPLQLSCCGGRRPQNWLELAWLHPLSWQLVP